MRLQRLAVSRGLRTEDDNVQWQAAPQEHERGLRVPEVVHVGEEVGKRLHAQAMAHGGDPEERQPAARAQGWKPKQLTSIHTV